MAYFCVIFSQSKAEAIYSPDNSYKGLICKWWKSDHTNMFMGPV